MANRGTIAHPLTQQLKKDIFLWTSEATYAFQKLKTAMISIPVLRLPDFLREFVIEADASGVGIGGVLLHRNKAVYERELMAIAMAVQKWRLYFLGLKFLVQTDQSSLKFILERCLVAGEYQKLITKLMGYDFNIVYKPGVENKVADALSRIPSAVEFAVASVFGGLNSSLILDQQMGDDRLLSIRNKLLNDEDVPVGYSLRGRYYIIEASLFSLKIPQPFHCCWKCFTRLLWMVMVVFFVTYQRLAREV